MPSEIGRLAEEAIQLQVRMAEDAALLAVAIGYAWASSWLNVYQPNGNAMQAQMSSRARTNRLTRRGVTAAAAARGLHVV